MPFPVAAAVGLSAASALASNMFQQNAQNVAFNQQVGMQAANYRYSQKAQLNAAKNVVEGYKMAGLSPALAAGGNFSPANVPSAPANSVSSHPVDMAAMFQAVKQAEMLDSEKAVVDANAHLAESKATETDIENGRKMNEDVTFDRYLTQKLEDWKREDPSKSALYDELLSESGSFTKGAFAALHDAQDFEAFSREVRQRMSEADLKNLIASHQSEGGIWKVLASRPVEEVALLMHDRNLKEALAANAVAQSKSEGEKLKLLQGEQKRLESEIKAIDEETRLKRYGKYGNMYEHGDLGAAITEIAGQGAEETAKSVGREGAKLGADVVRAKTGTPHGLFRSESKQETKPYSRETRTDRWRDRYGDHEIRHEDGFPMSE